MNPLPAPAASPELVLLALKVVVLPLLAFLLLAVLGKRLPAKAAWIGVGATGLAALGSIVLFSKVWQQQAVYWQVPWFSIPGLGATGAAGGLIKVGLLLDNLSVTMLVLASFISLLVQIYSLAYMKGDPGFLRYFAFLALFTGSMLAMVIADNLLLLFLFWELVGFSSYLLIGFWREREEAGRASMKAFLVNRVSDLVLLAGLLVVWAYFGSFGLEFLKIQLTVSSLPMSDEMLTVLGLCLFAGCVGKSAQFPLQVWLPDAMAGPTPVSSLLHAATMVAAGVFLLARCYMFFTPDVLLVMAVIGTLTMVLGAVAALGQYDIKRVLAYSTVSQLGYMVMGMGVGAYDASLLHLCTHAFFKAALFLLAGIIIHYVHHRHPHHSADFDPQDMRNMGGLRKQMPLTFALYLMAAAALVGLPLFSGFLSKDALITAAWGWADQQSANGNLLYYLVPDAALLTVLLTAWYAGRQVWLVFIRRPVAGIAAPVAGTQSTISSSPAPAAAHSHIYKEAPLLMRLPVLVLSVLCLGFFFSVNPFHASLSWLREGLASDALALVQVPHYQQQYLRGAMGLVSEVHDVIVPVLSVSLVLVGLVLAWQIGQREETKRAKLESAVVAAPSRATGLLAPLVFHTVLLDRLYQRSLVRPVLWLSQGIYAFDRRVIDRMVDITGKSFVVLAKFTGWADRVLVDGLVRLLAKVAGFISALARQLQSGRVQGYYIVAIIGMVLLVALLLGALG